ncbi:hypothetical protein FQA39_LY19435 [Lamprigera yunnana]|nr:hypothetical protein FQA39_LY19435 [Lamprigera yunnana]
MHDAAQTSKGNTNSKPLPLRDAALSGGLWSVHWLSVVQKAFDADDIIAIYQGARSDLWLNVAYNSSGWIYDKDFGISKADFEIPAYLACHALHTAFLTAIGLV